MKPAACPRQATVWQLLSTRLCSSLPRPPPPAPRSVRAAPLPRLHAAAAPDLVDSLFSLAAANWSAFHLDFLPTFLDAHPAGAALGPSERAGLLALFGGADLEAAAFERQVLAFANNAAFLAAAGGG